MGWFMVIVGGLVTLALVLAIVSAINEDKEETKRKHAVQLNSLREFLDNMLPSGDCIRSGRLKDNYYLDYKRPLIGGMTIECHEADPKNVLNPHGCIILNHDRAGVIAILPLEYRTVPHDDLISIVVASIQFHAHRSLTVKAGLYDDNAPHPVYGVHSKM